MSVRVQAKQANSYCLASGKRNETGILANLPRALLFCGLCMICGAQRAQKNARSEKQSAARHNTTKRSLHMEPLKASVGKISQFSEPAGGDSATFHLETVGTLYVSRKSHAYQTWTRLLRDWQAEKKPLYVEFDPHTRQIEDIEIPVRRKIDYVASSLEGNRLKVLYYMAPSEYFLRADAPHYQEMRRLLEEAIHSKAELYVTDSDKRDILDVRHP